MLAADFRWAFTRPWSWLNGIAANLVLSLLYLVVSPLHAGHHHRDWAILVGTYFAVFVLADVTSTNVLGVDTVRVRLRLLRGVPLLRILLVKNAVLLILVGVPTMLATAVITLRCQPGYLLELTLPGVLYPVLTWLGVGNLVSVWLPVAPLTLRNRWQERRRWRRTLRWLFCLGLPYVLCLAVDPMSVLPRWLDHAIHLGGDEARGATLLLLGLLCWGLGTGLAIRVARRRSIPFDDLR